MNFRLRCDIKKNKKTVNERKTEHLHELETSLYHLFLALKILWNNYGGRLCWTFLQGLAFHSIS